MAKKYTNTLSTKQFSTITGLPVATVTKMLRTGQIIGNKSSGRWVIPKDQLPSKTDGSEETVSFVSTTEKTRAIKASYKSDYSIREFCKITYLTEFGIEKWLKNGKIKGYRDNEGNWRVDADSLNLPTLKHLLRN